MVRDQLIEKDYCLYNGDSVEVLPTLPSESVDLSIYSPPFSTGSGGLYVYSSYPRDLSNNSTYDKFFEHYEFIVSEITRLTKSGRCSAVHCMDVPSDGANLGTRIDFPGDIIRLHKKYGMEYCGRYCVWKEPLGVRNRTMARGLAHKQIVDDSIYCDMAAADYLLLFRKNGENKIPVAHPHGLEVYAGERQIPHELLQYRGWTGKQIENRLSHWIWRQYASAFWDDIRLSRVMPFKESKDPDDERHVHALQLDVIERAVILRSNPGETVLTPFMGVGSEVYGAILNGRKGIGIELKPSYYKQSVLNVASARQAANEQELFKDVAVI